MRLSILLFTLLFTSVYVESAAQVDYESEIQPIFNANCTSCHGGQNGVTLESYSTVMNSVGQQYGTEIVVAGDAASSPLVDKIEPNPQFGSRMPQGGSLSSNQIDLIKQWINEGANEVPTSNEVVTDLPKGFELQGNYPNPFNPGTTIQFTVPQTTQYTISIYSVTGILVADIEGSAQAGQTSIRVDMSNQASGIYIYKVFASTNSTRYLLGSERMTLIK